LLWAVATHRSERAVGTRRAGPLRRRPSRKRLRLWLRRGGPGYRKRCHRHRLHARFRRRCRRRIFFGRRLFRPCLRRRAEACRPTAPTTRLRPPRPRRQAARRLRSRHRGRCGLPAPRLFVHFLP
ncbi:unnamed protein product, partial [Ectocarpus fasciculatus]